MRNAILALGLVGLAACAQPTTAPTNGRYTMQLAGGVNNEHVIRLDSRTGQVCIRRALGTEAQWTKEKQENPTDAWTCNQ